MIQNSPKIMCEISCQGLRVCAYTCVLLCVCVSCVHVHVSRERHHSVWKVFKKIHDLKNKKNHFVFQPGPGRVALPGSHP